MRKQVVALTAGLMLLGAAPAMADTAGQTADQSAGSRQFASSDATSTQRNPTNSNISVRIHSPGDNGSVSQTNSSSADSSATNDNTTNQMLAQYGGGSGAGQDASQNAWNGQGADSSATSVQYNPSNENISVRIHSPGSDGGVSQTNDSSANSTAHNGNQTTQDLSQNQGGSRGSACCSSGGAGVQAGSQDAANMQRADSSADSTQYNPSNENISVRIHSPGDNGSVSQTNSSSADSTATNDNTTNQRLRQTQGSSAPVLQPMTDVSRKVPDSSCCSSGAGIQAASQDAWNGQGARSQASSTQDHPANSNAGGGGDVTQSNDSSATSNASNSNTTNQSLDQAQGGYARILSSCCSRKPQIQAASQDAKNLQMADSAADSTQICPLNENDGGFGFGSVSQSNTSDASSEGANSNALMQRLSQLLGSDA